jgi:hypothetical protein
LHLRTTNRRRGGRGPSNGLKSALTAPFQRSSFRVAPSREGTWPRANSQRV